MNNISINFKPTLSAIVASLAKDSTFQTDTKSLVAISSDKFETLLSLMDVKNEFVDSTAIARKVEMAIGVEQAISRLLTRLDQIVSDSDEQRNDSINELCNEIKARTDWLNVDELNVLCDRISRLIGSNGIALYRKAEQLAGMGVQLEKVDVICDARPVFDLTHSEIVGLIPIVTLFLEIEGNSKPQILRISGAMLDELAISVRNAQLKLKALRELSDKAGLAETQIYN